MGKNIKESSISAGVNLVIGIIILIVVLVKGFVDDPQYFFYTIFPLIFTIYHGYNYFSDTGIPYAEISDDDFDEKIRKLSKLKNEGVISSTEFAKKNLNY